MMSILTNKLSEELRRRTKRGCPELDKLFELDGGSFFLNQEVEGTLEALFYCSLSKASRS